MSEYPYSIYTVLIQGGGPRLQIMRGPPIAPPLPRPPPPPPMMLPPSLHGQPPQGASQPIQHMTAVPQVRVKEANHVGTTFTQRW